MGYTALKNSEYASVRSQPNQAFVATSCHSCRRVAAYTRHIRHRSAFVQRLYNAMQQLFPFGLFPLPIISARWAMQNVKIRGYGSSISA